MKREAKLASALKVVLDAAIDNSCSCVGEDVNGEYHGAPEHEASGHARDCWAAMNHPEVKLVRELIASLRGK